MSAWRRTRLERQEMVQVASAALLAGAAVGAAVFYFGRIFIAREELRPAEPSRRRPSQGERDRSVGARARPTGGE